MTEQDTHILDDAIETVYDRPDTHGEREDSFGTIADLWSGYLGLNVDGPDVANMMVLLKVARNSEGHYHEDNWVDIAGYAENGAALEERAKRFKERDEADPVGPERAVWKGYIEGAIGKEELDRKLKQIHEHAHKGE